MLNSAVGSFEKKPIGIAWIIPGALSGFLPLLVFWKDMVKFYYQGDEWTQIDQIDAFGYGTWLFSFFGENFMPFFKFVWSSLLFFGHGNYLVFLVFSFLAHGLVVFFLGYLLRLWEFGLFTILFSQLILALNYTNIEILSQSIQVSNLLSYLFFLILLITYSRLIIDRKEVTWKYGLLLSLLSLLGALSFSRGVLNGSAIFGACLLLWLTNQGKYKRLLRSSLFVLVPCVLGGIIAAIWSINNSTGVVFSDRLADIGSHFFYQVSLNPWFQQIRELKIGAELAVLLLGLNLIFASLGVLLARQLQRPLLAILIFFFIGNAVLLAWGRNQMPIDTIASFRYQYGVLVVFGPLVGVSLERIIKWIPFGLIQTAVGLYTLWWVSSWVFDHWKFHVPVWSVDRGSQIRAFANSEEIDPAAHTISQFPGVTNERALQLTEKYNLH